MKNSKIPLVSIIVPVYNVEKYLRRCVDSILAQTFTDFELILVDDGSPDNCPAICDEYAEKDSRVRVIHKENGGVSAARNSGLEISCGEYIAFCDSDDYWDIDFLSELLSCMKTNNADVVVSGCKAMDNAGKIWHYARRPTCTEKISSDTERFHFLVFGILGGKYGWEVWSRLFRREIIETHHIRFCTICENYAEDMGFVLEYSLYAKVCCSIDYCGYNYYLREDSMMRSSKEIVKLDQMNEVSVYFGRAYFNEITGTRQKRSFAIIHFLIMRNEYMKLVGKPEYSRLPNEIGKIINHQWFRAQTKKIRSCYQEIATLYGSKAAKQILLLSHFCLHGNWRRFSVESAIAYRFFIK